MYWWLRPLATSPDFAFLESVELKIQYYHQHFADIETRVFTDLPVPRDVPICQLLDTDLEG